ncbi:hypothetical protein HRbin36_01966 [bacterium HR36]|nr:hypothetical protein HRbin36_01966 [bacterium HR36]
MQPVTISPHCLERVGKGMPIVKNGAPTAQLFRIFLDYLRFEPAALFHYIPQYLFLASDYWLYVLLQIGEEFCV